MKKLILAAILFATTNIAQAKSLNLCNYFTTTSGAKNCLMQAFFNRHTQTYYGGELHYTEDPATFAKLSKLITKYKKVGWMKKDRKYLESIAKADALGIILLEQDVPEYVFYALNRSADRGERTMILIGQIMGDHFDDIYDSEAMKKRLGLEDSAPIVTIEYD